MNRSLVKKLIICGLIFVLFGVNYGAGVVNNTDYKRNSTNETTSSLSFPTDWWPMYHHGLNLTGYSTSTAPITNKVLWASERIDNFFWYDPQRSSPAIVNDTIYIGACDTLYLKGTPDSHEFDSEKNHLPLQNPFNYNRTSNENPVLERWYEAYMICMNATTGYEKWKTRLDDEYFIWGSAAVDNGKVYITTSKDWQLTHSHLFCLDALTGDILWNFSLEQYDWVSPVVFNGNVFVAGMVLYQWPKSDCQLYCLDADTGAQIYNVTLGNGSPVDSPSLNDNRLYLSVYDREMMKSYLYCVNSVDGAVLWCKNLLGNYFGSSPVIYDQTVIVSSTFWDGDYNCSGVLWCLDKETGAEQWNYTTDNVCNGWSTPAIAYGKIYFASSRVDSPDYDGLGEIRCLNASTGSLIWNMTVGDFLYSSPAIADGKVYINSLNYGNQHGDIYCFDAADGDIIWQYWLLFGSYSSPAVAEGRLYVATLLCLYAFDDSAPSDNPPTVTITGPHLGIPGKEYNYTILAEDPEGQDMLVVLNWSGFQLFSWGIMHSGETVLLTLPFNEVGEYWVRARAQDIYHTWSNWTVCTTTISEPRQMFLFGFINHIKKESGYSIMNATFVFYSQVSPFKVGFLSSGDQIITLDNSTGHVGSRFIIGRFQAVID
jgi:outer membrane protein assembly factor BamB